MLFVRDDETPFQVFEDMFAEHTGQHDGHRVSAPVGRTEQEDTGMGTRRETPNVREVEVKGDKETLIGTDALPHHVVVCAGESLIRYAVRLIACLP
nr:hypothetical protein [Rhodocaloribacter litoris]